MRSCSSTISSRRPSSPYEVRLDGELVWPPDDGRPRPAVHTRNEERHVRLVFGSCRVGDPQPTDLVPPWPDELKALGIDALWAYAKQLQRGEIEWPDALLLLGDQVYADEVSPGDARVHPAQARTPSEPPGEQIADFEEYTQLYREAWSDPDIRWLLSTVPTTMIFDDHDVHDDWNISWLWVEEMRREALVGRAHHRRVHVVLDLPTPREPLPPELDEETTLRAFGPRRTPVRGFGSSPDSGTASRRQAAGPSTATLETRACSSSTRGQHACSRTVNAR